MTTKKRGNALLERTLSELLKEISGPDKKDSEGKPLYTLTDKMKVIDRVLKLEMIKAKLNDEGLGSGFDE